ncbi:MAG: isoprenyl transferase [Firmicutes bacterium]|nr:isoprenyl transferase [Bacillota bacterium]
MKESNFAVPDINEKENELKKKLDHSGLPCHIAIIMDGNGRWAMQKNMPRAEGHRAGVESLREIVRLCVELHIKVLTVYAFSSENWKRPQEEVNVLMDLLVEYLYNEMRELHENNVRINPIGRIDRLPESAGMALQAAVNKTSGNKGLVLNIALNYGGRLELVDAARKIAKKVKEGKLDPESINEETLANHLYTVGLPDPDLLIRPAGDFRVSNFLLWQLAYTEFWLTSVMWPDFKKVTLLQAILDFQHRERRFGGLIHS